MRRLWAPLLGVTLLSGVATVHTSGSGADQQRSDSPPAVVDVQKLGPQVGERVSDFSLPDQQDRMHTLNSLMGPKGIVLVFFRSADWWPYCKTQLVELQSRVNEIRRKGMALAAVSYDPVRVLADFSVRRGITFPLLSDAGSAVIKRYGILNTTVPTTHQLYGYPFPGTFVLNHQGVVTARFFEDAYQERNTISKVLVRLGEQVDAPATRISAPHLQITTYSTDPVVAPGTHFSLVLDIDPAPRVHVYAPGASGYKPIELAIEARPGVVLKQTQLPEPEDYFFKPLNEHVPVFQRRFKLVQDVMLDPSPQSEVLLKSLTSLTITGTLNYQACDDKICFNPESVPLSWTVGVKPLDRERVKQP